MSRLRSWKKEDFIAAVASSFSIANVLKKLNLNGTGGNYNQFYRYQKEFNLDISHFTGQGHMKGKTFTRNNLIPLDQILVENSTYNCGASLKKRLFKVNLLKNECYECHIDSWHGKALSLQLDHKNGVHNDNRIENLQLLCPNCHSQTTTFAGRNKVKQPQRIIVCIYCKSEFVGHYASKFCSNSCYHKQKHKDNVANYKTRTCIFCQKDFIGSIKRTYCTKSCCKKHLYQKRKIAPNGIS